MEREREGKLRMSSERVMEEEECRGWAARDASGFLSPYNFACSFMCYADVVWTKNKLGDSQYHLLPGDCEYCGMDMDVYCSKGPVRTFNSVDVDGTITKGEYSSYIVIHQRQMYHHHHHQGKNIHPSSRGSILPERHLFLQWGNGAGDPGLVPSTNTKPRLKWTQDLHEQFIEAVNQLGGADKIQAHGYTKDRNSVVAIGLNVHTALVEIREKLSIPEAQWPQAISELCALNHIEEAAVLSTCNKMFGTQGAVTGVGLSIGYPTEGDGLRVGLVVISAAPSGPANKAGILSRDVILKIDDTSTETMGIYDAAECLHYIQLGSMAIVHSQSSSFMRLTPLVFEDRLTKSSGQTKVSLLQHQVKLLVIDSMTTLVLGYRFRIPNDYPLAAAAPLLCAGITVYNPMMQHKMNQPGKSLGVIGLGDLNHLAVKFGKAFRLSVTVFSTSITKKDEALNKLGADKFLISSDEEQMKVKTTSISPPWMYYALFVKGSLISSKSMVNSLNFIIDTASGDHPFDPYIKLLKTGGTLVLVGGPSEVKLNPTSLIVGMKSISGSATGGMKERQEMLDFCAAQKIYPDIEMIPIEYKNEALERLIKGDVKYRFVIDIENSLK
ncbi:unnamed protein product [Camellia sinensis]